MGGLLPTPMETMKVKDMPALYIESLQDLFSAETQLTYALPKVEAAVSSEVLKEAIRSHLEETKNQAARLATLLNELGEEPGGVNCRAMEGLIRETDELIRDVEDPMVRDAALIGGSQKVEHYEISGYGTARTFAMLLGHDEHAKTLQATLDEEYSADKKLGALATSMINERAMQAGKTSGGQEAQSMISEGGL